VTAEAGTESCAIGRWAWAGLGYQAEGLDDWAVLHVVRPGADRRRRQAVSAGPCRAVRLRTALILLETVSAVKPVAAQSGS